MKNKTSNLMQINYNILLLTNVHKRHNYELYMNSKFHLIKSHLKEDSTIKARRTSVITRDYIPKVI